MLAAMMVPLPEHVDSDTDLPDAVDVVVIGGGIIGTCTALELAERGLKVALFEKGRIAGEQSGRNWGWCRQMGRDSREMPLIVESLKLWRGMNQRTGADTGFKQCGIAYMEADEKGLQQREALGCEKRAPVSDQFPHRARRRTRQAGTGCKLPVRRCPVHRQRWPRGATTRSPCHRRRRQKQGRTHFHRLGGSRH